METNLCKKGCSQCAALRAAALAIVGADCVEAVTIERLAEQSGLTVDEVGRHYPDASSCLYDTYERVARSIYEDFEGAFAAEHGWRRALARAGRLLLERMAANPAEARLCFVEILRSDHELLRRRAVARTRLVDLFVSELGRRRDHPEQFRMQLELLIGAGFQAIAAAIETGDITALPKIEPELESRALVFEPVSA